MLLDKSEKINAVNHARSNSGLKICYENINRRTTDIFNAKGDFTSLEPIKYKIIRNRAFENNNNYLDKTLRSHSPYFAGHKNKEYISKNLVTSEDLWNITNPEGKKKNYSEIMTKVQVDKEAKENNQKDNQQFDFFKPNSFNNSNKSNKTKKRSLNRSFMAHNSNNNIEDEGLLNKSAFVSGSNNLNESQFDFNEKCKSQYEKLIKGKIKRNQYLTENATLALMLLNKPKEYVLPKTELNESVIRNKHEEKKAPTSFDLHEKNKELIFSQIKEKVLKRKQIIENISNSLITQQKSEKENLLKKFQTSDNTFNKDNSKDHIKERYEKNYNQESLKNLKQNTYYDQIKAINSKHFEFNDEISQLNLDKNYRNHKKITQMLQESKNVFHELDNTKYLLNKNIQKMMIEIPEYRRVKLRDNEKKVWR